MKPDRSRHPPHSGQRGLSLVEMMVGITVGLFIVAAASMLVSMQLGDNRRLLIETQVQQDLRATADIITRELRRSGYWNGAANGVWHPDLVGIVTKNPLASVSIAGQATYSYDRENSVFGPFGFKREDGRVKTYIGGSWQELTDWNVVRITALTMNWGNAANAVPVVLPCPRECTGGGTACWPTLSVREIVVTITGHAASDPQVQRTVTSRVRLRNDLVNFNDAANPSDICPT